MESNKIGQLWCFWWMLIFILATEPVQWTIVCISTPTNQAVKQTTPGAVDTLSTLHAALFICLVYGRDPTASLQSWVGMLRYCTNSMQLPKHQESSTETLTGRSLWYICMRGCYFKPPSHVTNSYPQRLESTRMRAWQEPVGGVPCQGKQEGEKDWLTHYLSAHRHAHTHGVSQI